MERQAGNRKADVKESEEQARWAHEEQQHQDILAQNNQISERLFAICPTSPLTTPVQPVYASPTVDSP